MRTKRCALLVAAGGLCLLAVAGCHRSKDEASELGAMAFGNGDFNLAISCYSDVIWRDPKDIDGYLCRALSYGHKGEYDKAFADFDAALRIDPKHADIYHRRAMVYEMKGDKDKAKADHAKERELRTTRRPPGTPQRPAGRRQ